MLDDAEYEKGILKSTKIYEVTDKNKETKLVRLSEHSGKIPSKKWLKSDKVGIVEPCSYDRPICSSVFVGPCSVLSG